MTWRSAAPASDERFSNPLFDVLAPLLAVHIAHLSLSNVRTLRSLDIELDRGVYVLAGANGSGKTNLLEALAMLATTRGARGSSDGQVIAWGALEDEPLPAAHLAAQVEGRDGRTAIEITIIARPPFQPPEGGAPLASRRFRVNGVARRASDLIGRLRVVMFAADDIGIIDGSPSRRRRFLDIAISQIDPAYVRALQRYGRVLAQRNSLLRASSERRHQPEEFDFWDGELVSAGAVILRARARVVRELATEALARHRELSPLEAALELRYQPAVPDDVFEPPDGSELEPRLHEALRAGRRRDIARGATQIGPHRDDLSFRLGGHDAGDFASRGEQRTIALALRLAEVALSARRTGEAPVLLLDDILSELDGARRERVIAAAHGVDQVFITTPDEDRPARHELPGARRFRLRNGALEQLADDRAAPGGSHPPVD